MAPCDGAQRRTDDRSDRHDRHRRCGGCPPGRATGEWTGDSGQVIPLVAGVLALAAVILVGLIALGNLVGDRTRAQTAADAAALAGARGGRSAASSVTTENRGTLESFHVEGTEVEVTVRVGEARATARARSDW